MDHAAESAGRKARLRHRRIPSRLVAAAGKRRTEALLRAQDSLERLESAGIRAWVAGSLAKDRFGANSDVDFVVECARADEFKAFKIIEGAMVGFPFDMVPINRIEQDALPFFMEGALDASGLRARQSQAG